MSRRARPQFIGKLNAIMDFIKAKKRVKLVILASVFGYTPRYFKYNVLPYIFDLTECVELDNRDIIWVCNENETSR